MLLSCSKQVADMEPDTLGSPNISLLQYPAFMGEGRIEKVVSDSCSHICASEAKQYLVLFACLW